MVHPLRAAHCTWTSAVPASIGGSKQPKCIMAVNMVQRNPGVQLHSRVSLKSYRMLTVGYVTRQPQCMAGCEVRSPPQGCFITYPTKIQGTCKLTQGWSSVLFRADLGSLQAACPFGPTRSAPLCKQSTMPCAISHCGGGAPWLRQPRWQTGPGRRACLWGAAGCLARRCALPTALPSHATICSCQTSSRR